MKIKSLALSSILFILLSLCVLADTKVTMYAKDGRTISINENAVEDYKKVGWYEGVKMYAPDGRTKIVSPFKVDAEKKVGWYEYAVTKMYAPDGRTIVVSKGAVENYKKVGWYTEPVVLMYAADGRMKYVVKSQVEANKEVGWYTEPVTLMYSADDKTKYVVKSLVEAYKNVGWYTHPVKKMYAPDGRTIVIAKTAVEDYKKAGWYTEPVVLMWAYDGRSKYVVKSQVEANKKVGWYDDKNDVLTMVYAPDGRTQTIFKAFVDREKKVGWMDRDEFEKYLEPWVQAYVDVTWHHTYGSKCVGYYVLVQDKYTGKIVDVGGYEICNTSKYRNGQYNFLGGGQFEAQKSSYKNLNQVYNYLGKYFSESLYPHKGNYGFYEYKNELYAEYTIPMGGLVGYVYMGYKDNHHYVAVQIADWNFGAVSTDIIELSRINNKLLIEDEFGIYDEAKKTKLMKAYEAYYLQKDLDYTSLNNAGIFALYQYLCTTNKISNGIELRSYDTNGEITSLGNNKYRMRITNEDIHGQGKGKYIYVNVDFEVKSNGIEVTNSYMGYY